MPRSGVEINKDSAVSLAKWRIKQVIDDKSTSLLRRFALIQSMKPGGGVDEIAGMLYDMGIRLSIDANNEQHAQWIETGAAVPTQE